MWLNNMKRETSPGVLGLENEVANSSSFMPLLIHYGSQFK